MTELLPPACVEPDRFLVELAFDETTNVPASVQSHIAGCDRCSRELKELRQTRSFTALPLEEPSAEVDRNILAALDAHLAGEKVDDHLKLPEPERALGAERLGRHLSQPPAARPAPAPAPQISLTAAPTPSAPARQATPRPARARRRWTAGLLAAASIAVVGGGTLYLQQNAEAPLTAREQEAAPAAVAPPPPSEPEARPEQAKADEMPAGKVAAEAAPVAAPAAKENVPADQPAQKLVDLRKDARPPALAQAEKKQKTVSRDQAGSAVGDLAGAGAQYRFAERQEKREASAERAPAAPPPPPPPPPAPMAVVQAAPPPAAAAPAPAAVAGAARNEESAPARRKALAMTDELSAKDAEADSDLRSEAAWQPALNKARAAVARRDHRTAAQAFTEVLAAGDLPANVAQEALKGRLDALLALGRLDEAQAVADTLASRFPAQAEARSRVDKARAEAAESARVRAAAPAEAADAPAAVGEGK